MRSIILLVGFIMYSQLSFSQCVYCTSIEEARVEPEKVRYLDLSAKGLMSTPDSLEIYVNLRELNLSNNMISEISFDRTKNYSISKLDLSGNPSFNAMALEGIGKAFPNVKRFNLSNCGFQYLSPFIQELEELEELDLSDNALQFVPIELGQLSSLSKLNLNDNDLDDLYFVRDMWGLKEFSCSGNLDLNPREVGAGFLFKDSIESITMPPSVRGSKLPDELLDVGVRKIIFKDGYFGRLNHKICRNERIEEIVIDNVSIGNSMQLVAWLNNFKNLKSVEFRNCEIPLGLKEYKVDQLTFTNCDIIDKTELKKIAAVVSMTAINTDIRDGEYIGNAKIGKSGSKVSVQDQELEPSEEMLSNNVVPIVTPTPEIREINSATRNWVEMESSKFDIPANAFLSPDGSVYNGKVELKITEYMDPIVNALAGVPMAFENQGSTEIFASNGMFEFRAYDDKGNELEPNPDNIIQVEMKDIQPTQPSNLYAFNNATNNWEDIGTPIATDYDAMYQKFLDSLNGIPDKDLVPITVIQRPIFMKYKRSRLDPYLLDFSTIGSRKRLRKISKGSRQIYTGNLDQEWLCRKTNWRIDTTISQDQKDFLTSMKKDQAHAYKYWKRKRGLDYYYAPRMIQELKITPNFEHDNYTLTFLYKDTVRSFPVYPDFSGSVRKVQEKEKRNFKEYEKKKRLSQSENDLIERHRKKNLKKMADKERVRRAEALARMERYKMASLFNANQITTNDAQEFNRFGLTSFGMVNCDYFTRNVPDAYLSLDTIAVDSRGEFVKMPPTVRNIYLDDNSFVTTSSKYAPLYKERKSIAMIVISSVEIAVIQGWERLTNGLTRPKVKRINIKGDSPSQVRTKILGIE